MSDLLGIAVAVLAVGGVLWALHHLGGGSSFASLGDGEDD
jgi:hypothetical protein